MRVDLPREGVAGAAVEREQGQVANLVATMEEPTALHSEVLSHADQVHSEVLPHADQVHSEVLPHADQVATMEAATALHLLSTNG